MKRDSPMRYVIGRWIGVSVALIGVVLMSVVGLGRISDAPLVVYSMAGDLHALDLGYGVKIRLTYDGQRGIDQLPAWSPDGRAVAFVRHLGVPYSAEDPDTDIYWMSLDGKTRVRLTDNADNDSVPAWSPDGGRIAYLSTAQTGHQVILIRPDQPDSGGQILPITLPQHIFTTLTWTPDGTGLLFHQLDGVRLVPSAYDLATGEVRALSVQEGYYPTMSPNGARVAIQIPTRGGHALAVLTDNPLPRMLTTTLSPRVGVVWQDDAHLLYLSENRLELLRVNVDTGAISPVYTFTDHVMNFAYHP